MSPRKTVPANVRVLAVARETWVSFVLAEPCLLWPGRTNAEGYGVTGAGPRGTGTILTHRATFGPSLLELDHLCSMRRCVQRSHLEPVTPAENARRRRRTLCRAGLHPMTGSNLLHPDGGSGWRRCRACKNDAQRARRDTRRAAPSH